MSRPIYAVDFRHMKAGDFAGVRPGGGPSRLVRCALCKQAGLWHPVIGVVHVHALEDVPGHYTRRYLVYCTTKRTVSSSRPWVPMAKAAGAA